MSEVIKLESGKKLNLHNSLAVIIEPGLRCFVELRGITGTLLEPRFEIPAIAEGIFAENVKLMPNLSIVFARFFITKSDGTTDAEYEELTDTYRLDTALSDLGLKPVIVDQISAKVMPDEAIEGVLESSDSVTGIIEEVTI